ncbi:Branched-chain amino acid transport protein [Formivibrio citricus]|uniref:Branched-chain amino acid transport protein n=1 Tax=Formivibrio citricus TaxID=83765 RepID=A0A1I4Y4Y9_9NEIS|nr:AzlD domain-containing protein [Formivibrio citricus]SFN32773.1 Branched-chain amino acid transport protein [Formivibrio citricus]
MKYWLVIFGMAAATFPIRASFLVFGNRLDFPPLVRRALHYVPAAVLSALIVPMALMPKGSLALAPDNPYLVGTLVAGVVAFATRKTLLAIVASFVVYGMMRLI